MKHQSDLLFVELTLRLRFQVMIPISLYVTIELVKLGQVFFIQEDKHLYYEPSDKRIECRALNITEDLGQVCVDQKGKNLLTGTFWLRLAQNGNYNWRQTLFLTICGTVM